jgi:hypothetical protein
MAPTGAPDAFLPFNVPRDQIPPVTQFRSAWLHSSLRALRELDLFDRYLAFLPDEHKSIVKSPLGVWLPGEVSVVHYAACERLGLDAQTQTVIGAQVAQRVHGTILAIGVKVAREAGVTPWTVLAQFGRLWDNIWIGGGVAVGKLGPKEARLEIAGWPCARFTYCKNGIMGVTQGLIELFCRKVYVRDVPKLCTATGLVYRIAWA